MYVDLYKKRGASKDKGPCAYLLVILGLGRLQELHRLALEEDLAVVSRRRRARNSGQECVGMGTWAAYHVGALGEGGRERGGGPVDGGPNAGQKSAARLKISLTKGTADANG